MLACARCIDTSSHHIPTDRVVVRMKGGDPLVYGRVQQEMVALRAAGIPFELVPGVTSALSAPAAAGIPVTDKVLGTAFAVLSGKCTLPTPHSPSTRRLYQVNSRICDSRPLMVVLY